MADEQSSAATIELGCTLVDAARVYVRYPNEELSGRLLHGRTDQVTIATKIGWDIERRAAGGRNTRPEQPASAGALRAPTLQGPVTVEP